MALSDTFKNAVNAALAAAGDTVSTITYRRTTIGVYDPDTDTVGVTNSDTTITDAFVYRLDDRELDYFPADIEMQKVIIHADRLSFTPESSDYVIINSVEWEVKRIKEYPGAPMYMLYIQKS